MPAAAISSSMEVAAKPLAMTAASASSSRRSCVSFERLGELTSMTPLYHKYGLMRRDALPQPLPQRNSLYLLRKNSRAAVPQVGSTVAGNAIRTLPTGAASGAGERTSHEQIPQRLAATVGSAVSHGRRHGNHSDFPRGRRASAFREFRLAEDARRRGAHSRLL